MQVASIDVGSNTALLLIAERQEGTWVPVFEEAVITRVSEGMDQSGVLEPEPVRRTRAVLATWGEMLRERGVQYCVATGTAPFRRAQNGAAVAHDFGQALGFPLDVVSGDKEAALSLLATQRSFPELDGLYVVDIGGASTELISADAQGHQAISMDLGAVRLSERFLEGSWIDEAQESAVRRALREQLANGAQGLLVSTPRALVGVAGTVTTLAAASLEMDEWDAERVHQLVMSRTEVRRLSRALSALTPSQRARLPGIPVKRADVIATGAIIVEEVMDFLGVDELRISDRGVRWGRLHEEFDGL